MPTTMDLVQNVTEKKPSEFQANFSELVTDRVRDLLAGKRVEIAKTLFTPPVEQPAPVVDTEVKDKTDDTADVTDTETSTDQEEDADAEETA